MTDIIKSRERVRELAEVYTSEREVKSMLDLVGYLSENINNTFLEPACGNGNFLIEILRRRLQTIYVKNKNKRNNQTDIEFSIIISIASIYGIDISEENILEARERLLIETKNFYAERYNTKKPNIGFWDSLNWILNKNIIIGDFLNKFEDIVLVEYTAPKPYYLKRQEFKLVNDVKNEENNVLFNLQKPLKNYKITSYLKLCC
jgi:hypothetical protein